MMFDEGPGAAGLHGGLTPAKTPEGWQMSQPLRAALLFSPKHVYLHAEPPCRHTVFELSTPVRSTAG